MKKVTLVLCTVLLTLAAAAEAQKATTARLGSILERAVTGEREVILRYQAFAARADEVDGAPRPEQRRLGPRPARVEHRP